MSISEYLFIFILCAAAVFGIVDFIRARVLLQRFYETLDFTLKGQSDLQSPATSELLTPLKTDRLYSASYRGQQIEHCRAFPLGRGKFTLSKVQRKHNQTLYSVTILRSLHTLPSFCLLPLTSPETMLRMTVERGIELKANEDISNRYYIRSDHPELIEPLGEKNIAKFLLAAELISIECIDNTIIIKRAWPITKIHERLTAELDCAVAINGRLTQQTGPA